jgi:SAM-dependent methyltransferase
MGFKDHFSTQAAIYARARPTYPPELFVFLAEQAPGTACALDVATGNGQAALGLAQQFDRVIGIDASQNQIDQAKPGDNITYYCAGADKLPVGDASIDLITIAQALHWLPLDQFYTEAKRALRPGGVIAAISYGLNSFNDPAIDGLIQNLYNGVLDKYWPAERRHVENGYRDLPFPFNPIAAPEIAMPVDWTIDSLTGYLNSWSATQRYQREHGQNPVDTCMAEISAVWGAKDISRRAYFPLSVKIGR